LVVRHTGHVIARSNGSQLLLPGQDQPCAWRTATAVSTAGLEAPPAPGNWLYPLLSCFNGAGNDFGVRACAERAGISERAWWAYERGEAMPPADAAVAVARILGATVEQLAFRRVETVASGDNEAVDSSRFAEVTGYPCAGTLRGGTYINNCPMPGELHIIRWAAGHGTHSAPRQVDTVVLGMCPLHAEQVTPWNSDHGPDLERLSPSLHLIEANHPLSVELPDVGDGPFWTNIGIPRQTRKFYKTTAPQAEI